MMRIAHIFWHSFNQPAGFQSSLKERMPGFRYLGKPADFSRHLTRPIGAGREKVAPINNNTDV